MYCHKKQKKKMTEKKSDKCSKDAAKEFLGKVLCSQEWAVAKAETRYATIKKHPGVVFALLHKLDRNIIIKHIELNSYGGTITEEDNKDFEAAIKTMNVKSRFQILFIHTNERAADGLFEKKTIQAVLFNPYVGKYDYFVPFATDDHIRHKTVYPPVFGPQSDTDDKFDYAWIALYVMLRIGCPGDYTHEFFDEDNYSEHDFRLMINNFMCYMLTEAESLHVFEVDAWLKHAREEGTQDDDGEAIDSFLSQGHYTYVYNAVVR